MTTGLGRIDPPHSVGANVADAAGPDGTSPSPEILRELHDDFVREKRRAFLRASPLLVLAAFAVAAAIVDFRAFGGLLMFASVAVLAIGQIGYRWLSLRRADPLALYEREQRETEQRRVDTYEHAVRASGIKPGATMALIALISIVTLVEFSSGTSAHIIQAAALVKANVRAGQWWRLLTATYLHGNIVHLFANMSALLALGSLIEIYDQRWRVPLVYLLAAIGGSVLSTLATNTTSVGASGGIIGLAGYLLVLGRKQSGAPPAWIQRKMKAVLGTTVLMGLAAFYFIDNAAHVGGALAGAGVGVALRNVRADHSGALDSIGAVAAAILILGALFTIVRLLS
jgi:membrane associated rhomboid family serine protease